MKTSCANLTFDEALAIYLKDRERTQALPDQPSEHLSECENGVWILRNTNGTLAKVLQDGTVEASAKKQHFEVKIEPPVELRRWEEIRLRRLWHKLGGGFSTPYLGRQLEAIGIDPDKLNHATLMRIAWEEVFVIYGERLEIYELLKEQVSNPDMEWGRTVAPEIIGVPLKDDSV